MGYDRELQIMCLLSLQALLSIKPSTDEAVSAFLSAFELKLY